jgi:hypothetical protein
MEKYKDITRRTIYAIILFGITMGMFEAAVVIYLRELYYPGGFTFPLQLTSDSVAVTEFFREIASLFMIGAVAWLSGRNSTQRFAWFLIIFAIWDIFYYVFLKALIGWPESFMIWDILFLIPVHWTGPVITPIIAAVLMILLGASMLRFSAIWGKAARINRREWWLLGSGAFVVFISFIIDYTIYLFENYGHFSQSNLMDTLNNLSINYVPAKFYWWIYILGIVLIISSIIIYARRNQKALQKNS